MFGKVVEKRPRVFEAILWNKLGDHPKVRIKDGQSYGTIMSKDGIKVVRRGEVVVRVASGEYNVYQLEEYKKKYEPASSRKDYSYLVTND